MGPTIDQVRLNFNPQAQLGLNLVLALVMFGIALDLRQQDFMAALGTPKALTIGLGMLLVPSCPAGHISNFFTQRARGNAALPVSISALSTLGAMVMTPLNVAFWGGPDTGMNALLRSFSLVPLRMLGDVAMLACVGWPFVASARMAALGQIARIYDMKRAAVAFNLFVILGFGLAPLAIALARRSFGWPGVISLAALLWLRAGVAVAAGRADTAQRAAAPAAGRLALIGAGIQANAPEAVRGRIVSHCTIISQVVPVPVPQAQSHRVRTAVIGPSSS